MSEFQLTVESLLKDLQTSEDLINDLYMLISDADKKIMASHEREMNLNKKFRQKADRLEAENKSLREKKPVACTCPIGQCNRDPDAIMGDLCWFQWCMSKRGAEAVLKAGGAPKSQRRSAIHPSHVTVPCPNGTADRQCLKCGVWGELSQECKPK
jgi:hypothetical protein